MMDHVTDLLGPYLDGELRTSQIKKIEKHVETCEVCCSELDELMKLSALLQENTELPILKSEEQFVAEVGLLMERQPEPSAIKRMMVTGWKAIPVGLACTWIFVQTSSIITTLFTGISRVAPDLPGFGRLTPAPIPSVWSNTLSSITQPFITQVLEFITKQLNVDVPIKWHIPIFTVLPFVIGTIYACWLASWWVVRERKTAQETI